MKQSLPRAILVLLAAALCLGLTATVCEARAGGGHSFSGGHSSGSHSSGGGFRSSSSSRGGSGHGVAVSPMFLLVLVIVVIVIVLVASTQAKKMQSAMLRRGRGIADNLARENGLQRLRAEDPGFDPAAFGTAVGTAFRIVQEAWSAQVLDPIRPFVSDGVFERFSLQVAEMKALGFRNVVTNLRIVSTEIAAVALDEFFQIVTLRIEASADDRDVSLKDGAVLREVADSSFAEYWSFLRRRGVRTPAEGGFALIQGQCPNCGASVAMNQHAKCPHCQALLRNGSHDWVLAEITQESEWDPQSTGTLPGQIVLRRRDEGLNVQSIEDFASVAFFRRLEAERTASVKPLRKLATQAFCEALAPTLGKSFRARCGVGSVDVAGFVSGNETEQAVVIITWSGTEFRIERPEVFREGGETGVRSEVFVLSREATARTDPDQAVSSAHCPNCGGPRTDNVSASCDFCGCVLNDGRLGWVLDAIHAVSSPAAQQLLQRCRAQVTAGPPPLPPMPSMRGPALIGWLVQTVYADGRLDPDEEAMLRQAAQRWEVAPATLEGVLSAARSGSLQVATPMDANEARAWLETMIEAAFANGTLDRSEIAVLQRLAATQGMDDKALGGLITSARSRLLKQARQDVRAAKAAGMPPLPKS